jgi:hypothetical protein
VGHTFLLIAHGLEYIPWAIMKLINLFYCIKTTGCRLLDGTAYGMEKRRVRLPVGTARAILHGTHCVKPFMGAYRAFVRKEKSYWPQNDMVFNDNKTWDARISLGTGAAGTYYAFIAEVSPEIELLATYYFKVGRETGHWVSIDIQKEMRELKGIRKLGKEIEIVLG